MATQIKICGLNNDRTLQAAVNSGADYIGFVHFSKSPRHVSLPMALRLAQSLPDHIHPVLLLVNPDTELLHTISEEFGHIIVQLHGHENVEDIVQWKEETHLEFWKALPAMTPRSLTKADPYIEHVTRILFDTPPPQNSALPGGNGVTGNWAVFDDFAPDYNWALAGGLTVDNVADAIAQTGAPLVDISTGVEDVPGVKNVDKITAFCQAVRDYDRD